METRSKKNVRDTSKKFESITKLKVHISIHRNRPTEVVVTEDHNVGLTKRTDSSDNKSVVPKAVIKKPQNKPAQKCEKKENELVPHQRIEIGTILFARMKGFSLWPGKVSVDITKKKFRIKLLIKFFLTHFISD